jgi:hypothetical protein
MPYSAPKKERTLKLEESTALQAGKSEIDEEGTGVLLHLDLVDCA